MYEGEFQNDEIEVRAQCQAWRKGWVPGLHAERCSHRGTPFTAGALLDAKGCAGSSRTGTSVQARSCWSVRDEPRCCMVRRGTVCGGLPTATSTRVGYMAPSGGLAEPLLVPAAWLAPSGAQQLLRRQSCCVWCLGALLGCACMLSSMGNTWCVRCTTCRVVPPGRAARLRLVQVQEWRRIQRQHGAQPV